MNRHGRRSTGVHKDQGKLADIIQNTDKMIKGFDGRIQTLEELVEEFEKWMEEKDKDSDELEKKMKNLHGYLEQMIEPEKCAKTKEMDI